MIYFNSRYLSEKLKIRPAKWKRWAREFLQPDPLGGYQSGYARQFSYRDAFRVFLGGYLVSELKYAIADARQILDDLDGWLKKHGLYALPNQQRSGILETAHIYIFDLPSGKFAYTVRTIQNHRLDKINNQNAEVYSLEVIGPSSDALVEGEMMHARILLIHAFYTRFLESLDAS
jgi:hypothetical protein